MSPKGVLYARVLRRVFENDALRQPGRFLYRPVHCVTCNWFIIFIIHSDFARKLKHTPGDVMPWKYKVACYLISIGPLVLVGGCEKEKPNIGQSDPLPSSSIVEADALKANNEGVEFYKRGEYGKAITCFDVAINTFNQKRRRGPLLPLGERFTKKQHKSYSLYYANRARSHAAIQDYAAAIDDFSKAIEHDPDHANLYSSRAVYYQLLGSKSKAAADREKAKSLGRAK